MRTAGDFILPNGSRGVAVELGDRWQYRFVFALTDGWWTHALVGVVADSDAEAWGLVERLGDDPHLTEAVPALRRSSPPCAWYLQRVVPERRVLDVVLPDTADAPWPPPLESS